MTSLTSGLSDSPRFPYTTLFRSLEVQEQLAPLDRFAQPVLELDLLGHARVDVRRIEQVSLGGLLRTSTRACPRDRKSTRLNSSHEWISYAVSSLKQKKGRKIATP